MRSHLVAAALVTIAVIQAAQAEDKPACTSMTGFTIDLVPTERGYLVPLQVAGSPERLMLDFSAAYLKLDRWVAADYLHLSAKSLPEDVSVRDNEGMFPAQVIAPSVGIGPIERKNVPFLIGEHRYWWGAANGSIGATLFRGLDIELDLAHNRLGLYLPPKDCAFAPFWPTVSWGNAEYKVAPTGGFYWPLTLDGKQVLATISSANESSTMPLETAKALFGLNDGDPRLIPVPVADGATQSYHYPFKELSGGNRVTIANPAITILADQRTCGGVSDQKLWNNEQQTRCFGGGDLKLGRDLLRKLHLYFGFKDKTVYFTLADPPAPK